MENLRTQYGPWAVIAGASEGTGAEFARQLAEAGINLLLVSRRLDKLESLATELRQHNGIEARTLALDLSRADAAQAMFAAADGLEVGLYVSNAGSDLDYSLTLDRSLESLQTLIRFNIDTVVEACYLFLQPMRKRGRGGAVVMSSVSGLVGGQPGAGMYSATKAFELVFAEALGVELAPENVAVIGVAAPPMATAAAAELLKSVGVPPEALDALYKPADVVRAILSALGSKPSLIFDFIGIDTEAGAVTTEKRHARIDAVIEGMNKLLGAGKAAQA